MDTAPRSFGNPISRLFYPIASAGVTAVVFLGFARTYYLKEFYGTPPLSALVHLHGFVMTLWLVLFGLQVWLVTSRRVQLHRRMGVLGTFWAAVMLVVGTITAIEAAKLGRSPPGTSPLPFLVIPLGDMLVFGVLVAFGIALRKHGSSHKRLMLLSTLSILAAAIARIPLDFIRHGGPPVFFGLTDLFIVVCLIYDTARFRRLHPAFALGAVFVIGSHPLRLMLAATPFWAGFSAWLVR